MDIKKRKTKHWTITESHNGNNNQHRIGNNRMNTLEQTSAKATGGGGGLKCIFLVLNLRSRFCCCWSTTHFKLTSFDIKLTRQGFENACDIVGLPRDSTCILEAKPGKPHIKRSEPGILLISLPSWFSLQISEYDVTINYFCGFSVIGGVI